MKQKCLILIFCATVFTVRSQVLWNIRKDTVITYYYRDGDEFSGDVELSQKWDSWYGWARSIAGNKEQQYYSDYQNHELKEGCLNLTVKKNPVTAKLVDWMSEGDSIKSGSRFDGLNKRNFNYTSGMISSKEKYLYGYFEIRFKAPQEAGLWPAFWLYGGSPNEEIDFMELKGERQNQIHVDTHCPNRCDYHKVGLTKKSFGGWIKLTGDLSDGFNIVSGTWDEDGIRYYLNGKYIAEAKVKFSEPKNLVANIAVPSDDGPFHPAPDPSVVNFSPLSIDYIRVWTTERANVQNKIFTVAENDIPGNQLDMKRPVRSLYGKKRSHDNEGIFVSVFRNRDRTLKGYCSGLKAEEQCVVRLKDASGKTVHETPVKENTFNIPVKAGENFVLEVVYLNKIAKFVF